MSPKDSSSFVAIFLSTRLMILPDLVFGRPAWDISTEIWPAKWKVFGKHGHNTRLLAIVSTMKREDSFIWQSSSDMSP